MIFPIAILRKRIKGPPGVTRAAPVAGGVSACLRPYRHRRPAYRHHQRWVDRHHRSAYRRRHQRWGYHGTLAVRRDVRPLRDARPSRDTHDVRPPRDAHETRLPCQ